MVNWKLVWSVGISVCVKKLQVHYTTTSSSYTSSYGSTLNRSASSSNISINTSLYYHASTSSIHVFCISTYFYFWKSSFYIFYISSNNYIDNFTVYILWYSINKNFSVYYWNITSSRKCCSVNSNCVHQSKQNKAFLTSQTILRDDRLFVKLFKLFIPLSYLM